MRNFYNTYSFVLIFIVFLIFFYFAETPDYNKKECNPTPTQNDSIGTYIARGKFVYLADTCKYDLNLDEYTYLPAGTRFIAFNKTEQDREDWRLILTEHGLWGYIKDDYPSECHRIDSENGVRGREQECCDRSDFFWKPEQCDIFRSKEVVIIQQPEGKARNITLGDGETKKIWFTPNEIYKKAVEGGGNKGEFIVYVDYRKKGIPRGKSYPVKVGSKFVTKIETNNIKLTVDQVDYFELIDTYKKDCGSEVIRTTSREAGFGLLRKLSIVWKDRIETIKDKDIKEARSIYKRKTKKGNYSVKKKERYCEQKEKASGSHFRYIISYSNPDNVDIDTHKFKGIQKLSGIFNKDNGCVDVSSSNNFFTLKDHLYSNLKDDGEIHFLISRLGLVSFCIKTIPVKPRFHQ